MVTPDSLRLMFAEEFGDTRPRAWAERYVDQLVELVKATVAEQERGADVSDTLNLMRRKRDLARLLLERDLPAPPEVE